jgi:hypothetical protein
MRRSFIIPLLALSCTVSSFAAGQEPPRGKSPSRDQHYEFEDDPLAGVGLEDRGQRIRVRPGGGRVRLIRPRTHFIVELTRAVENL